MVVFANAKINIGLNIIEKRSDGYHNIETLFYPIPQLYDVIEVLPASSTSFKLSGNDLKIPAESNLVMRAHHLMEARYGSMPVAIELLKVIPSGAGLGGGSADAAAYILALNKLFDLKATRDELAELISPLGADCPFFIYNTPHFGTGIGNELSPFSIDLSEYEIQLVTPPVHVSTPLAYSLIKPQKPTVPLRELLNLPVTQWKDAVVNDFEKPIVKHFPDLANITQELYAKGAIYASMSGSGSTFFGLFKKDEKS